MAHRDPFLVLDLGRRRTGAKDARKRLPEEARAVPVLNLFLADPVDPVRRIAPPKMAQLSKDDGEDLLRHVLRLLGLADHTLCQANDDPIVLAVDPDAVLTVAGGRRPVAKLLAELDPADRAGVRLTEMALEPRGESAETDSAPGS